MKHFYSISSLFFVALLLFSCEKNQLSERLPLKIKPNVATRVTALHFDDGDCIGLTVTYASGGDYVTNAKMTYAANAFTGDGLLWYNNLDDKSTLKAYYPYTAAGVSGEFTITANQTGGCTSSDLLCAVKSNASPATSAVAMTFYHMLSQINITVTNNSAATVTGITVSGSIPTALVDWTTLQATAKAGVAATSIQAFPVTAGSAYRLILVPQQADLTVSVAASDGKTRTKVLSGAQVAGGKSYDLGITLTNIDIGLSLSGDVNDWQSGGDLGASTLQYQNETYRTVRINGQTWMAENMRYLPAAYIINDGVWYPADGVSAVAQEGLLYGYAKATMGETVAPIRGICPDGWHIPSKTELESAISSGDLKIDSLTRAGFYNTTTSTLSDNKKGYLLSSTADSDTNCWVLNYSSTVTTLSCATLNKSNGYSLRCVKNS